MTNFSVDSKQWKEEKYTISIFSLWVFLLSKFERFIWIMTILCKFTLVTCHQWIFPGCVRFHNSSIFIFLKFHFFWLSWSGYHDFSQLSYHFIVAIAHITFSFINSPMIACLNILPDLLVLTKILLTSLVAFPFHFHVWCIPLLAVAN